MELLTSISNITPAFLSLSVNLVYAAYPSLGIVVRVWEVVKWSVV